MTRDETKYILASISAVYPPHLMPKVTETTINIWHQVLQDLNCKDVSVAVVAWLTTNKYPPTISDIRERITLAKLPEIDSADAAWGKLMRAVSACGWNQPAKARSILGERIWRVIAHFSWMHFCTMPMDSESTFYAQFRSAYESRIRRETEQAQMPPELVIALGSMREKHTGIESGEK